MSAIVQAPEWDFVTSDTHYNHVNVIRYDERPFVDVEAMNEAMIERHNSVVGPRDRFIHLGDFGMGDIFATLELTKRLNGIGFIVPGNHDRISSVNKGGKLIEKFTPLYRAAGWTILPEVVLTRIAGVDALMSHFPYTGDSHDKSAEGADRYADVRPKDTGLHLVHGHIHNQWVETEREFNAGVTVRDYTPVARETVEEWISR
jgi:calcineurin-like phosphoesterase family protein